MRYKLTIEYEGTNYSGWQKQKNSSSIQENIEIAIEKFCGQKLSIFGAGRTDAGVHASGQVAHVDFIQDRGVDQILKGINFYLQNEKISVLEVEKVSQVFDARFSAIMRHYRYKIINRKSPLTYDLNRYCHIRRPLNPALMQDAADLFIGEHDFTTFRSANCQSKSPIKTIESIFVKTLGEEIIIDFSARSFLHTQVRSIMGCILKAGTGSWDTNKVLNILNAKNRDECAKLASASGLYLLKVDYDE